MQQLPSTVCMMMNLSLYLLLLLDGKYISKINAEYSKESMQTNYKPIQNWWPPMTGGGSTSSPFAPPANTDRSTYQRRLTDLSAESASNSYARKNAIRNWFGLLYHKNSPATSATTPATNPLIDNRYAIKLCDLTTSNFTGKARAVINQRCNCT